MGYFSFFIPVCNKRKKKLRSKGDQERQKLYLQLLKILGETLGTACMCDCDLSPFEFCFKDVDPSKLEDLKTSRQLTSGLHR